ncbi:MAG: DNA cytosine methyltransferase [Pseudomonadales bacterium]
MQWWSVNVDSSKKPASVIAFCAGYGGIERGLELAGVNHRVVAYVEIEAFAIANLVAKMETGALGPAPIWSDLKTFPAHLFRDRVDLITGGYPCQPFSAAGKRKGADDPRHLWPHIRRHVQTIRPFRCFFENVEGHISLGLREVIADLEADSYKATWGIFSAAEVGAPHRRKRVFIMADAHPRLIDEPLEKICSRRDAASSRSANVANTTSNDARAIIRDVEGENGKENGPQIKKQKNPRQFSDCGSDVADPESKRCKEERKLRPNESEKRPTGGSEVVADADSERQPGRSKGDGWQARSRVERSSATELADASGERLERHTRNGDSGGKPKQTGPVAQSGLCEKFGSEIWDVEPQLGRVAHGVADRVDRLRLLGNGVVPQQAARAWTVLSEQINEKDDDRV